MKYDNVRVGEIQNWLPIPIEYKGKFYIYDEWYCTLDKLVLIIHRTFKEEVIEIFNESDYFSVIEHPKGKYEFAYIELIDD